MSIERVYYCDGPDNPDLPQDMEQLNGCPAYATAVRIDDEYIPGGFLRVTSTVQGGIQAERHFCSWDCLLRYAATQHPTEYVT